MNKRKEMIQAGKIAAVAACLFAQMLAPQATVQAACSHKYAPSYVTTDALSAGQHDFQDQNGIWHYVSKGDGCRTQKYIDVYVYKCTKCGANLGGGYTVPYTAHYNVLCPNYPIEDN